MNRHGTPQSSQKKPPEGDFSESRCRMRNQPNSVSSLFFNDAAYFSEVLIELLAVPDACARPKVSRMAATKLP
jgi:hypothetical protein